MKRLLYFIMIIGLLAPFAEAQNRLTTWSTGQTLTSSALNNEFDNVYTGNIRRTAGYWGTEDDVYIYFGDSDDVSFEFDSGQTQDALLTGLSGSYTWIITDKADIGTDYQLSVRSNPALVIHSADATTAADYIELQHNQTDSVINTGAGGFSIQASGTEITDITSSGDWVFKGTTPSLTIGDAGEEDTGIVFDGNAQDFYIGLYDTDDHLYIGTGSTVGSNGILTIENGGDVGIGTGNPDSLLHLQGDTPYLILEEEDQTPNAVWQMGVYGGEFRIRDVNNSTYPVAIAQGASTDSIFIDSDGDIGIGTGSPSNLLHLKDSADHLSLEIEASAASKNARLVFDTANENWTLGTR